MARLVFPTPSQSTQDTPSDDSSSPNDTAILRRVLGASASGLADDELLGPCRQKLEELLTHSAQNHDAVSLLWDHLHRAGADESLRDLHQRFTTLLASHLKKADSAARGTAYTAAGRDSLNTIARTWGVPARLILEPSLIPDHLSQGLLVGLSSLGKKSRCPLAKARELLTEAIQRRLTERAGLRGVSKVNKLTARDVDVAKKVWEATNPRAISQISAIDGSSAQIQLSVHNRVARQRRPKKRGPTEIEVEERPLKDLPTKAHRSLHTQSSSPLPETSTPEAPTPEFGRRAPADLPEDSSVSPSLSLSGSLAPPSNHNKANTNASSSEWSSASDGAANDNDISLVYEIEPVDPVTDLTIDWCKDQAQQHEEQSKGIVQGHQTQEQQSSQNLRFKATSEEAIACQAEASTNTKLLARGFPITSGAHAFTTTQLKADTMISKELSPLDSTREALDALAPGRRLNGSAVDSCLRLLQPCNQTWCILSYEALSLSDPSQCQRLDLRVDDATRQLIIPLLHDSGTDTEHWSVAVVELPEIERRSPVLRWYSSLISRPHYEQAESALKTFCDQLVVQNDHIAFAEPLNVQQDFMTKQDNTYDSGIMVVMIAANILYGKGHDGIPEMSTISPHSWRMCLFRAFENEASANAVSSTQGMGTPSSCNQANTNVI